MGAEENVRCPAFLAKPFVAPSSSAAPAMPFTPSSSADKKSVCNRFLIGFPYNWDHYADEYLVNNDGLPIPTNLDTKDAYSPNVKIDAKLKFSDVGSVGTRHVESELKGFDHSKISKHCSTNNVEESSSDEINGMWLIILEKIKNCNIPSVENPTAQMCSTVDIELTGESEMECAVIEEQERKKDSIQKQNQDCTECIVQKDFMHFSTYAEMRPLAEDKVTVKTTSTGTEEQLSTVKGHDYPSVSGICTRSGLTLGFPASVSRSEGSKGKSVFSSKMKTAENKPNCLNCLVKGFTHTSEDHASVKGGIKNASTGSPAQDPTLVSQNYTFSSSKRELACSHHIYRVVLPPRNWKNKNDGLAVDHIAMENDSCLKGSPRYITKYAVQSDIPVMNHSSEDKSLEMIGKTITDKMNNQDDGSVTEIIVAYNVLSSPSQACFSGGHLRSCKQPFFPVWILICKNGELQRLVSFVFSLNKTFQVFASKNNLLKELIYILLD
ncbi:hypothetical protein MUK42_22586, partial [Musa troglodytarum]